MKVTLTSYDGCCLVLHSDNGGFSYEDSVKILESLGLTYAQADKFMIGDDLEVEITPLNKIKCAQWQDVEECNHLLASII